MFYLNNAIIIQITIMVKDCRCFPKHDMLLKIPNDATPIIDYRQLVCHSSFMVPMVMCKNERHKCVYTATMVNERNSFVKYVTYKFSICLLPDNL